MGNSVVAINQEDVSVRIRVLTNSDGTPYTGLTAASAGHEIWYQRGVDNAAVTDSGSAADHGAVTDAHTDWEFIHIRDGWYRVDVPDAAFAEGEDSVIIGMNATGYSGISETVIIEPAFKFQGSPSSVTSTTTTFPSGTTPLKGDKIRVLKGTGEPGNEVLITSVAGEVATHAAFETGISATTSTILLIAGDAVTGDGGINNDVPNSDAATPTEVESECSDALTAADVAKQDKMLAYFQLALRQDANVNTDRATELSEINADEGSGVGTYDNQEPKEANLVEVLGNDLSEGAADNDRNIGY